MQPSTRPQSRLGGRRIVLALVLGSGAVAFAAATFVGCAAARPTTLGVASGRLTPCPSSPNCVSSQAARGDEQFVEPLQFEGDAGPAWRAACEAAKGLAGASVVEERDDYLWVEVSTRVLRFVDDLELVLDAAAERIDVRSSSRIGHSDFGTNRRRVEALRADFRRRLAD